MIVVLGAFLPGPAHARDAVYTVRRGDNLTVIARHFGTTVEALRRDNTLSGDVIVVGQRLTLTAPFNERSAREPRWTRPARRLGDELRPFGPYQRGRVLMPSTGADVACRVGEPVVAPATGIVRFLGPMDGFGHLAIIDHGGGWATVLAPLDPAVLAVEPGTAVLAGDRLGLVGQPPVDGPPYLHIELRRDDKAVAPDKLYK